ncbi:unnamed protein product [Gongylonema pulchrum]|uniref:Ovule protein n=1 Tax=Gongylonema pulchrum TaxID=637853 RepID=A0A183DHR4_9BILA|nr:unnamed protein product [Gongylonema pulchrum]
MEWQNGRILDVLWKCDTLLVAILQKLDQHKNYLHNTDDPFLCTHEDDRKVFNMYMRIREKAVAANKGKLFWLFTNPITGAVSR